MGHTKITGRSIKQKWQTNLVKNGDRARTRAMERERDEKQRKSEMIRIKR